MARTPEEEQRRKRRRRLIRGLIVGGAALGLPALANSFVARRAQKLPQTRWGQAASYDWRHGRIAFQRLGSGPPLLLLHSFGAGHSGIQWRAAAELLSQDYETLVPDLIGWGDSARPSLAYDHELFIELLSDFLRDVVGRPAVLVAAGMTAAYGIQVAVDRPELLRAVGLVVPLGIDLHGDEPDLKDAIVHRFLRLPVLGTSALNLFTSRAALAHQLREALFDGEKLDPKLLEAHYRAAHLPGAQAALAAYLAGYLNHNVTPVLDQVEQPTWLAWGREVSSPAVESADLWLSRLRAAELEVFEKAASLPQTEVPEAFVKSLREFLSGL